MSEKLAMSRYPETIKLDSRFFNTSKAIINIEWMREDGILVNYELRKTENDNLKPIKRMRL